MDGTHPVISHLYMSIVWSSFQDLLEPYHKSSVPTLV